MAKVTGFLEYGRQGTAYRPVDERVKDYRLALSDTPVKELQIQAARCMDCGIPFCNQGCPLGNIIPDWNDLAYRDKWEDALQRLHSTNNFPEMTGLVCPAPCEAACVLAINQDPVTIKSIEWEIIRRGYEEGWVKPSSPSAEPDAAWRWWAPGPLGWLPPSSSLAPVTPSPCSRRTTRSAVCCATASPTSSSRSG